MVAQDRVVIFVFLLLSVSASITRAEDAKPPQPIAPTVIKFGKGEWDTAKWLPMRLANQAMPKTFVQLDGAIGTTTETFTKTEWSSEVDNAILLHDLGSAEAEVAVNFTLGQGFGGHSCPGLCISPQMKDGVVESSIAVFVADYTMAVWHQTTDKDGRTVHYKHMMQLGRWTDPAKPHTLRCRISKKEGSVALRLDDSDVVVFSFIGNASYGSVEHPVNSLIGLWGCHGQCTFHEMTIFPEPTLQFIRRGPEK